MRLTKIKLAGFKSFVDPTTVPFPSNLTGIIGPNGCGKSNVIDAVRWVMGESSAKHLRGESMADVIFSGSSGRKPVATASVDLIFDNSDGKVGGEYAGYNEINVRRQVTRDGQSSYFLNNTRCRRRDITGIFLGTGLGPRSYSIIEQGTISRLIEAKPEELRVFIEEAAGISKYKERRRETENRMRHTRDNLERLDDLRDEVEKQVEKLQRQAKNAERYREFKDAERKLHADLLALRWSGQNQALSSKDRDIAEAENRYQESVAQQRSIESQIEVLREQQTHGNDQLNEVQGRYYGVGADISRLDQGIEHARESRTQMQRDLAEVVENWQQLEAHLSNDKRQLDELQASLESDEPVLIATRETEQGTRDKLVEAEQAMQTWQGEWDTFNSTSANLSQSVEINRTRITHLDEHLLRLGQRTERAVQDMARLVDPELDQQITTLETVISGLEGRSIGAQDELKQVMERVITIRNDLNKASELLDSNRHNLQTAHGRQVSLEALQQAALGQDGGAAGSWIADQGIADVRRFAQALDVKPGWEVALEGVLGILLEAVCVDDFALSARHLGSLKSGSVALIDIHQSASASTSSRSNRTLLSKINTPWSVDGLLAGIFVADSLDEALAQRSDLAAHESIVTRNGEWIGSNWARVNREEDARSGVLAREQELRDLNITVEQSEGLVRDAEQTHNALQARLQELEASREQQQATIDRMHRELSEARAEYAGKCARRDQMVARRQELTQEVEELRAALDKDQTELTSARSQLEQSLGEMEVLTQERSQRQDGKEALRQTLEQSREQARSLGARVHELALRVEAARSSRLSTQRALERMQEQQARLETRRADMEQGIEQGEAPLQALEAERAGFLEQRLLVEKELAGVRDRVEDLAQQLRSGESKRHQSEEAVNTTRTVLEQGRLSRQETQVRLSTIEEQIGEIGFEPQALLEAIDDEVTEASCASELEAYGRRIQRLGAINLAAIDEFKEESERLEYLQLQHADLQKSLETLEDAIGKIDRETRSRFKDTFDKVNEGIKEKFPRLFGGGHAYLELTGEDMLDSGVTVMARPPGKKNSSIHLLSGGEKALTAVSLIFSIFDLNPAPFCMLDEVDAPLDDANVGRFCALVKEMSDRVQFIVITHNKVTMEMANHLSGVTMHEPGVSRLVSVDVEQATQMVAS